MSTPNPEQGTYVVQDNLYMRKCVKTEDGKLAWLYKYEMFANTVDLAVFDPTLKYVMLVKRGPNTEPAEYRNCWAIPGGFLNRNETSAQAAAREYHEETGEQVQEKDLIFVYVADEPNRDPRQRTVSMVYTAIADMKGEPLNPVDIDEINGVIWMPVADLRNGTVPMAFDHMKVLGHCLAKHKQNRDLEMYNNVFSA